MAKSAKQGGRAVSAPRGVEPESDIEVGWWRHISGWIERLSVPVPADSIGLFRCVFGWVMTWHMGHYVFGGRAYEQLYGTFFKFRYPGFGWVPVMGETGTMVVCWVLLFCAVSVGLGVRYRMASALFALGYSYIKLYDATDYNNHDYLIAMLAATFAVIPTTSVWTMGRQAVQTQVPTWGLWLLRFHIALPYAFGGLAKLGYDWIVLRQPMTVWFRDGRVWGLAKSVSNPELAGAILSWGGVVFDLAIVPLLLWKRTRLWAYLACVAFHLTNANMFRIGPFPWLMIVATALFLAPDWPRRWRLTRAAGKAQCKPPTLSRLGLALLAAWVLVQLVLPFRHLAYPGPANWNERGQAFAWRMKLRDKVATTTYFVATGSGPWTKIDDLDAALTARQLRALAHKPDMVRQFAHYLRDQIDPTGSQSLRIRVEQKVALNGRPPQLIIDPEVDLLSLGPETPASEWILPLEKQAP